MKDFTMPKWNEMTNFEKAMTVLEWVIAISYIAICIIFKWNMPTVANYLLGAVFLVSGLASFRTERKLAFFFIGIAIIEIVITTIFMFMA